MSPTNAPVYTTWQNNTHPCWWKDPGLRLNCLFSLILYFGFFTGGYDGSYLNGLQAMTTWNDYFGTPSGSTLGLVSASAYFPSFVTVPFISWSCDRFGRKPTLIFGASIIIVGAALGTAANSIGLLIAGRAIVGAGAGFVTVSTICLLNELVHPRLRGISTALYLTTYYVGAIVSSWLTFGCVYAQDSMGDWAWRIPTLFQALGPAILLVGCIILPESPRWLIAKGRHAEARQILTRIHANGQEGDELVNNEIEEIATMVELEKETGTTWRSLVATPGNRRRMLVLTIISSGSQWNGLGILSYYLAPVLRSVGITSGNQIAGFNGGLSIYNFLTAVAGALLVDKVGRRKLWITSTTGMLFAYSGFMGLSAAFAESAIPNSQFGNAVVAFIFLVFGFYSIAWTPLSYAYSSEILTSGTRAKGMAYFSFMQSVCLAFNQYVNPIALEAIAWRYYGCYIAMLAMYLGLILWLFVETRGHTAEEVGLLFDHLDGDVGIVDELLASKTEQSMKGDKGSLEHLEKV